MAFVFPLEDWLRRIDFREGTEPTRDTLRALHRAQVFAVPFENLDPLTGRRVCLEPELLCAKILGSSRGGYCFELNGLFLLALKRLGFSTQSLAAKVAISEGNYGKRSHQITVVICEGEEWLVDVGFGGSGLIEPILLRDGMQMDQTLDVFRIVKRSENEFGLEQRVPSGWRTLYAFPIDPVPPSHYLSMNEFTSSSPQFLLTQVPVCVRTVPDSRIILFGNQLKIRKADGQTSLLPVTDSAMFRQILESHLGIILPEKFKLPEPRPVPAGSREV